MSQPSSPAHGVDPLSYEATALPQCWGGTRFAVAPVQASSETPFGREPLRSICLTLVAPLLIGCVSSPTDAAHPTASPAKTHRVLVAAVAMPEDADDAASRDVLQRELFRQLDAHPGFAPMRAREDAQGRADCLLAVRAVPSQPGQLALEGRLLIFPSGNLVGLAAGGSAGADFEDAAREACGVMIAELETQTHSGLPRAEPRAPRIRLAGIGFSRTAQHAAPELAARLEPQLKFRLETELLAAGKWALVPGQEEVDLFTEAMDAQDMGKLQGAELVVRASVTHMAGPPTPELEITLQTLGMADGRVQAAFKAQTKPEAGDGWPERMDGAASALLHTLVAALKNSVSADAP